MHPCQTGLKAWILCWFILTCLLALQIHPVFADENEPPMPLLEPRLSPRPQPQPVVEDTYRIYNELIVPYLPEQSRNADIADSGQKQEAPGRGIRHVETGLSSGATLYSEASVCNDFNKLDEWSSTYHGDMWSDHYAGWGTFAVDDGWFYHAGNVLISREQVVGAGNKEGNEQFSLKIASNQPYAAGISSPVISVSQNSLITISVKYMIFDHDTHGQDYDWVSLGIKPDAHAETAIYNNGFVRGQWAELSQTITAGESGEIMIMIQAQSPSALNSNVYLDDVRVSVDGVFMVDCTHEKR